MKLTVGFSKPTAWFVPGSWAIRLAENSPFSHAFIRWHSNSLNRDMVYQASHGLVHFMSGEKFDKKNKTMVAYEFELDGVQALSVIQKCVDFAGSKYGKLELIGMAFERLTGIRSPFRDGNKTFVCSELVGEVLRQCRIVPIGLDLELAGPRKLEMAIAQVYNLGR